MRELIIDTDGVSDDMRAISLALKHPDAKVIAITTVHGCVGVEQATANVLRLQRAVGLQKSIPVYMGASEALIRKPFVVQPFFGIDGIGDCPDAYPNVLSTDFPTHYGESAALALIRLTNEHKDVTVVCLGPLTNLALAYKLDPNIAKRIGKLVILGGNYYGVGNVSEFSSAEFNFHGDPEAAKIVIEEMDTEITLVPWENVCFKGAEYENIVDFDSHLEVDTPLASFLSVATHIPRDVMRKRARKFVYCDEIAVAIAIDEQKIAKKTMDIRIGIEVQGQLARGQVVVGWARMFYKSDGTLAEKAVAMEGDCSRRKVHIITDYDVKMLDQWMHNTVLDKKSPW